MSKAGTSPWVYVGCGCFGAALLVIGGCMTMGLFGAKMARDFEAELRDPAKREERAREILGTETLPAGFQAQMHFKIPLLLEMVILSDGEPLGFDDHGAEIDPETLGDNAFVYLAVSDLGDAREDFERLLEGDVHGLENVDVPLDFRSEEILGRGEFELPPQSVRYAIHRGAYREEGWEKEGTYAVLLVDCPSSSKVRAAFYWQRGEVEGLGQDGGQEDLAAAAYEEELRGFMSHFALCG